MRYLRSTSVPAPYISVTPDACPNVFEEKGSNMKSMPPRYSNKLPTSQSTVSYKHFMVWICLLCLYDFFIFYYFFLFTYFVPLVWRQVQSQIVTQPSGQSSSAHIQWLPLSMISSTQPPQHGSKQYQDAGYTAEMQVMLCHFVQHSYQCLFNSANCYNNDSTSTEFYYCDNLQFKS